VPLSVKSHISIDHHHVPAGYIAWWPRLAPATALVVQILQRAGAIVVARTTEPQSMMHLECASNLFGATTNPHNTSLSSGGSSGGEGALGALRGSLLGIGSDVGGSIRVPAAACGIYGLKPTGFRVPTTGWSSTPPGADAVPTVLGPMSSSLEGIEVFMQVVAAAEAWKVEPAEAWKVEPALVPLGWRESAVRATKEMPLRLGLLWHDGVVLPHPPVTRALREFCARVGGMENVEVLDFTAYKHDEAWAIVSSLYYPDGGEADLEVMAESGEPLLPLTEWMIKENPAVKCLDRGELEYWLEEREEYRLEHAQHWNKTGVWDDGTASWKGTVDALVCPVGPGVATRHGTAKYWTYTAIWNLLDYPALAFPAGTVDKAKDPATRRTNFLSDLDRENWNLCK
jgi:amidase